MTAPRKQTKRKVLSENIDETVLLGRYNPSTPSLDDGEVVELQLDKDGKVLISQPDAADYDDMQDFFGSTYTFALDYDADGNLIYAGKVAIGTAKTAAVWQIKKITYDANGNLTDITWADGNKNFDNVWNDRTTLTYS